MSIFRRYKWKCDNKYFEYEYHWSQNQLDYLENLPHDRYSDNYSYYVFNEPYREELENIIEDLVDCGSEKLDFFYPSDVLQYLLNFVQYLNYYKERGEYPRYPVETLIDKGGDCEDTAILMAFVADFLGYDCAFLHFEGSDFLGLNKWGHCDLGIANTVSSVADISGTYWEKNGRKYYYMSCNGKNYDVGEYSGKWGNKAKVILLNS